MNDQPRGDASAAMPSAHANVSNDTDDTNAGSTSNDGPNIGNSGSVGSSGSVGDNGNGNDGYHEIALSDLLTLLHVMHGNVGNSYGPYSTNFSDSYNIGGSGSGTGGRSAHIVSSSLPSPPRSPHAHHAPILPIFHGHGHVPREHIISSFAPDSDDDEMPTLTGQEQRTTTHDGFSQEELQTAINASLADDANRGKPDINDVIQRAESEHDRRKMEDAKPTTTNDPTTTTASASEQKKRKKPFYVCPKCNAELDMQHFGAKMMHQSYRCDSCGYDELELLHQVTSLIAAQSLTKIVVYNMLTTGTTEDETVEAELICIKERIEADCLKVLIDRYKVDEEDAMAANNDEIQKKECAVSFCDGVCRKVKCCENHYIHLDCLFEHVLRSEQEYCPVCRDPFMVLLFYKLDPVRMHRVFLSSLSPFGKTRLAAFLLHSRQTKSKGRKMRLHRDKLGSMELSGLPATISPGNYIECPPHTIPYGRTAHMHGNYATPDIVNMHAGGIGGNGYGTGGLGVLL